MTIKVRQGNGKKASENYDIGSYQIIDIPPAPKGEKQIEVKFSVDKSGILTVKSRILPNDEGQTMVIEPTSVNFRQEELEQLKLRQA